jgi:aryl-alcohol dehydrogenase-like predicted oxidoreductase
MMQPLAREDLVVSTKIFWPTGDGPNARGLSRKHLTEQLETSLRRLRTDYVDLLLCHRLDPAVPVVETVRTLGRLIDAGKVLYWGLSSVDVPRIVDMCRAADALGVPRPIACQPRYNLLDRSIEEELLPTCRALGIGQVVFSPLAGGRIVREGTSAVDALAWCLRQRDVCALFGASSPEQVRANAAAGAAAGDGPISRRRR